MPSIKLLHEFPLKGRVWRVALHPKGTLAVVASYFEIGAWELPSGKLLWKEAYSSNHITNSMALSPDGGTLAVSFGVEFQLRDPMSGKISQSFATKEKFSFTRMLFSPDGASLWAGSQDVMQWSPSAKKCMQRLVASKSVRGLSLNTAGDRLAVAADKSIWLWDLTTNQILRRYPIARFGMNAVLLSPDAATAWTLDGYEKAKLWSFKKAKKELLAESIDLGGSHHEFVADPSWKWILASGQEHMTLFDPNSGARLAKTTFAKKSEHRWADDLSASADGTLVLSAHIDEAGRLWDIAL